MRWARALLALLLVLGTGFPGAVAQARSFVWAVHRDGATVAYLGGTVHVLGPGDWPLPAPFERAFRAADRLVLETDLGAMADPSFAASALGAMTATPGRRLEDRLRPSTYRRLARFARERGLPMAFLSALDPGALALSLPVLELSRLGLAGEGVDAHFARRAAAENMPVAFLETPQEQLGFMTALGRDRPDAVIRYVLDDLERYPDSFEALKRAWRAGDRAAIEAQAVAPVREHFPAIHRLMLVDRNEAWLGTLARLLSDAPVEVVLVGAAHLVGPQGLIHALEARGYTVRPLD